MKYKKYKIGGYVRDKFLGITSKDVDYAVEAPSYKDMKQDILEDGVEIYLEKPEYFTIRGNYKGEPVDFVLCRREGHYYDGRHPDKVEAGTIHEDLARRDFTRKKLWLQKSMLEYFI